MLKVGFSGGVAWLMKLKLPPTRSYPEKFLPYHTPPLFLPSSNPLSTRILSMICVPSLTSIKDTQHIP